MQKETKELIKKRQPEWGQTGKARWGLRDKAHLARGSQLGAVLPPQGTLANV